MEQRKPNLFKNVKVLATLALVFGAFTIVGGVLSLSKLQTAYSVMQFLPTHHPALQMDRAVRKRFNIVDQPVFIGLINLKADQSGTWLQTERLKRIAKVTEELRAIKGVDFAISIATIEGAAEVDGSLSVGRLTELVPINKLGKRVLNDKLLNPNLVSGDARTTLIYVALKTADVSSLVNVQTKFKKILTRTFPESHASVGGVPAVQTDLGLLLNKELVNFLLLTVVLCALTLLLIFRTYSTIFIPLILTGYCNLMVFTMMAWTGITFTILSSTIPILVFIAVVSLSVHILLRFYEDSHHPVKGETHWQHIWRSNRAIFFPNFLGSLTTCAGFLMLLESDVPLIRTYGVGVAAAIMLTWFLTSIFIAPLMILFPKPEPRAWVHRPARWALWITENRKQVVLGTIAFCAALAFIGRHLDWTGRLFDDLPKGQEARYSTEKIDKTMGGVVPLEVVVTTPKGKDWNDPVRIANLDKLVGDLRKLRGIGTAQSLPEFLRASGLHEAKLPATRAAIAETYFLYSMAPDSPLKQYLTANNRGARIQMKIHDLPSNEVEHLLVQIRKRVQHEFPDCKVQIGGMGAVVHLVQNEISHDLIFGFWKALLCIMVLLTVIFRSLRWAIVACIPNLVPPIVLLGYLALTHTPIKPGVAIIFSIALGLAFNNTVYVLNRLIALMKTSQRLPVAKTFYLEGNPCLVSTLVVMMGFFVFMFSYFELNRTFGACMIVSILAGLLGDLIFLPAMLQWAPWLLSARKKAAPAVVHKLPVNEELERVAA